MQSYDFARCNGKQVVLEHHTPFGFNDGRQTPIEFMVRNRLANNLGCRLRIPNIDPDETLLRKVSGQVRATAVKRQCQPQESVGKLFGPMMGPNEILNCNVIPIATQTIGLIVEWLPQFAPKNIELGHAFQQFPHEFRTVMMQCVPHRLRRIDHRNIACLRRRLLGQNRIERGDVMAANTVVPVQGRLRIDTPPMRQRPLGLAGQYRTELSRVIIAIDLHRRGFECDEQRIFAGTCELLLPNRPAFSRSCRNIVVHQHPIVVACGTVKDKLALSPYRLAMRELMQPFFGGMIADDLDAEARAIHWVTL